MQKLSRRHLIITGAAGLGSIPVLSWFAAAQQDTSPGAGASGRGQGMQGGSMDAFIAACLLAKGRKQIEICRFAMDKLQNDECKRFAQAEIEEHEHIKRRLGELGFTPTGGGTGTGGGQDRTGTGDRTSGADRNTAAGAAGQGRGDTTQGGRLSPELMQIVMTDNEVADQCIATLKSEMGKLQGPKFDKAFIGDQLHSHYGLFDHAVVFRNHARQVVPVLNEGRPIIERHIATCKQIKEHFEQMKG